MSVDVSLRSKKRITVHFLVDQLTLSQPGGAHYPHPVLRALLDFQTLRRPCSIVFHIFEGVSHTRNPSYDVPFCHSEI